MKGQGEMASNLKTGDLDWVKGISFYKKGDEALHRVPRGVVVPHPCR